VFGAAQVADIYPRLDRPFDCAQGGLSPSTSLGAVSLSNGNVEGRFRPSQPMLLRRSRLGRASPRGTRASPGRSRVIDHAWAKRTAETDSRKTPVAPGDRFELE
jgi:hypothetical protein